MELSLLRAAIVLYLGASGSAAIDLLARRSALRAVGTRLLYAALVVHLGALATRSVTAGHFPITSFAESMSTVAALVVVVFVVLWRRWSGLGPLLVVVGPLAFAMTLASHAFHRGVGVMPPQLRSVLLPVHVLLAIVGNALFCLAFVVSLAYLVQERRLKRKRLDTRVRLPALETLDQLNHRFLTWGLSLFTLAIVSGIVWAHLTWGQFWSDEPRLLWAVVTWIVYAAVFQGRVTVGLRGRRAAALTIVGFAVLVSSLIGVNLFTPGRHGGTFG